MHVRELPSYPIILLRFTCSSSLAIFLSITHRQSVQIIIFNDDIITLGSQLATLINRAWFKGTCLENRGLFVTLIDIGGYVFECQSGFGQHSGTIRLRINAFSFFAAFLHLDRSRFRRFLLRTIIENDIEFLGQELQSIRIAVSFNCHQVRDSTFTGHFITSKALENFFIGIDVKLLGCTTFRAVTYMCHTLFRQSVEFFHHIEQPTGCSVIYSSDFIIIKIHSTRFRAQINGQSKPPERTNFTLSGGGTKIQTMSCYIDCFSTY